MTDAIEPYLQCVLHYRRIQNVHNGMRWFDIKRMGLSITHKIGTYGTKTLQTLDSRYAIQIPTEVLSTGFTPNPRYNNDEYSKVNILSKAKGKSAADKPSIKAELVPSYK